MEKELTKAEEQIMQSIWQVEKGFAKDILAALPDPKPAYNTVLTVVRILVDKGYVGFKTYGKSNEYFPLVSKEVYSQRKLNKLKKNYFNNSTKELLSFFIRENKMDLQELDDILKSLKKESNE
ncbi:BlaI/MecI/CopY family transcriptional regulator [Putridiphycobacter roseus]|uniref:BlaI/MecI/CopY family transcriptional regulator n=1 Tax=Putridiphycobacter roseus TaxID=2219161 RepID=A0A2W1N3V4_9FLAO|nr:BlaI/MecI/CopY family transcriptional regulator [Putridiphycobacter roseus]PZE17731.1 BlaI/MecI/CopY family transcriptional regulator [Putridiphycobacter roseus]